MTAPGVDCALVQQMIGRYHDGDLSGDRRDEFEQHLLMCPPCLVETRRLRVALAYLVDASAAARPDEVGG